ncbi:HTH-type transcriptional regulator YodB [Actinomadura rubteroloni]|uniref:HTH-type transcriptional regulator YodB n=1 Tax=Actinomadura rubteroloni TaxID=1926885 RepID=A0A2P4ULE9_9ACTN|nr:helix-turn-helix domain-containing protein [Actinomadura rubteroloni]POM25874.1 HTH-type transcriptional regulator YodB [Actinomadura rubteroloni]
MPGQPRCDEALALAFEVLGKRWTGMLLGVLAEGDAGFAELRRGIGGISDSVLSARITELVGTGLIEREPPDGLRYRLTATGRALVPSLNELTRWANAHLMPQRA